MNKNQYKEYLKSDEWKSIRLLVLKRDGFKCRVCNSELDLVAHHRTYEHIGNERKYIEDLTTLCGRCHTSFHNKDEDIKKPVKRNKKKKQLDSLDKKHIKIVQKKIEFNLQQFPYKITREFVNAFKTDRGGYTSSTLGVFNELGVNTKKSGWKNRMKGKYMTYDQYLRAEAGRHIYYK